MNTAFVLREAYKYCKHHGHRYTKPREIVLKILLNEGKPLGAYDILQQLAQYIKNPKPPTVYRAIQFWHQKGFIHSIDSLKSYIACLHGHHVGQTQFLICHQCQYVKELECTLDNSPPNNAAFSLGFTIMSSTTEYKGLCSKCS